MADVIQDHIEIVEGAGGPKPRVAGTRIRVVDIAIWHEKQGMSAAQIVQEYPQLTLADVYAALAYYWDHRAAIERRAAEDAAFEAECRRKYPSLLQEKLRDRGGSLSLPMTGLAARKLASSYRLSVT
jgi:uncharacterized protein (DUF433 family)